MKTDEGLMDEMQIIENILKENIDKHTTRKPTTDTAREATYDQDEDSYY